MDEVGQVPSTSKPVPASPALVCANCESPLTGRYCAACGQPARGVRVGLHDFLHEAVHEVLHLDGKIARTMILLLRRPGQLTSDFLSGKRSRYVSPLRLYLMLSAIYFALALALGPDKFVAVRVTETPTPTGVKTTTTPAAQSTAGPANSLWARLARGGRKLQGRPERLAELVIHDIPKAMFLLMPFFAFLLFLFHRNHEPFFVPHLYFSIHYHAFVFFLSTCVGLLTVTNLWILEAAARTAQLIVFVYLYLSLRRVYGDSRLKTFGKTVAIGLLYVVGLSAVMVSILTYRLITL